MLDEKTFSLSESECLPMAPENKIHVYCLEVLDGINTLYGTQIYTWQEIPTGLFEHQPSTLSNYYLIISLLGRSALDNLSEFGLVTIVITCTGYI